MEICRPERVREGFTLIELLTVMAIIVVLMAVALPSLRFSGATQVTGAVRQAGTLFEFARSAARSSGGPVRIVVEVDPTNVQRALRTLLVQAEDPASPGAWRDLRSPLLLPDGVLFDPASSDAQPVANGFFYELSPSGSPASGSLGRFVLTEGFVDGGTPVITDGGTRGGFHLTASGRPFYYRSPDEIP